MLSLQIVLLFSAVQPQSVFRIPQAGRVLVLDDFYIN